MITHDQMIFVLQEIHDIPRHDHGQMFMVGMPVVGNTQLSDASILAWYYQDREQPTNESLIAAWNDPNLELPQKFEADQISRQM